MTDFRPAARGPLLRPAALTVSLAVLAIARPCPGAEAPFTGLTLPSVSAGRDPEKAPYESQIIPNMPAVTIERSFIFFPPVPPPLDGSVDRGAAARASRAPAPAELGAYVNEIFYAPLSSLLDRKELNARSRQRLAAYRDTRDTLLADLQLELARTRTADHADRQHALEVFARAQAPRLATLEETAEDLRQSLVDGHYGWFALRRWKLGAGGDRGDTAYRVAATMQAYAFYKKGLTLAQRGLLREVVLELGLARPSATGAAAAQPYYFFSPEMARVQLPGDLPATLSARLAEYQAKKSALKKELYDAVYEQEKASFLRGNVLQSLATAQTARLAELEKLAEEIRRDLAGPPNLVPPHLPPPLPSEMTERLAVLLRKRDLLQAKTQKKIDEVSRQTQPPAALVSLHYGFNATGLLFQVVPSPFARNRPAQEIQAKLDEIIAAMAAIAETYGRAFTEFANERSDLASDIARSLGNAGSSTAEAVLSAAIDYADRQSNAGGHHDYRTAVFEPGLSPEQRRLLFGGAIRELNLSLPSGDLQP